MSYRKWSASEVADCMGRFRAGQTYQQIAAALGRNVSSVGYVIRHEDLAEEARECAAEELEERNGRRRYHRPHTKGDDGTA